MKKGVKVDVDLQGWWTTALAPGYFTLDSCPSRTTRAIEGGKARVRVDRLILGAGPPNNVLLPFAKLLMALKSRLIPLALRCVLPPVFLCQATADLSQRVGHPRQCNIEIQRRRFGDAAPIPDSSLPTASSSNLLSLPLQCPGCGAFTQSSTPEHAGYYSASRKSVKTYLAQRRALQQHGHPSEAETFARVLQNTDESLLKSLGFSQALASRKHSPHDPSTEMWLMN